MTDEVITYADAARWLPADVRYAIEETTPCPHFGAHQWEDLTIDVTTLSDAVPRTLRYRQCACGVSIPD